MKHILIGVLVFFSGALLAQNQLADKIDEYLTRTVDYGFSGAVAVSKNGQIVLNKGYGLANRELGLPNTSTSIYSTGSVTKQFTAAAILKLEMMDKVNTSDKISKYFNNVPDDKKDISLHHLLTHTSGFTLALNNDDFDQISKEDYLNLALSSNLEFAPGDDFGYSNVAYSLLAMIIEMQSSLSYEAFLNKYLFSPAGMKQTGYALPDWKEDNFVSIYNGLTNNGSTKRFTKPSWHLKGNGGILSTTTDMIKWVEALATDDILSLSAKKKIFTPYRNDYGYGWDVLDEGDLRQHDGGSTLGLSAELRWFVADEIVIMLYTNATINGKFGFRVVRDNLEQLAMGDKIQLPPKLNLVKADMSIYVGTFSFGAGEEFEIKDRSGSTVMLVDNQALLDMIANPKHYSANSPTITLNAKFEKAFDKALSNGDFSGFSFTGAANDLKMEIENEIRMEGLEKPHFKIVKSFRSMNDDQVHVTQIALSDDPGFNYESLMLNIFTRDNKFVGMSVDFGYAGPSEINLYPIGKNKFQGYSLTNKLNALIEIDRHQGSYSFKINGVELSGVQKIK